MSSLDRACYLNECLYSLTAMRFCLIFLILQFYSPFLHAYISGEPSIVSAQSTSRMRLQTRASAYHGNASDTGFFGGSIGLIVNISTYSRSTHVQLNASLGYTQIYGDVGLGLNLALNATNGGLGLPHGQRGNGIRTNVIATGAVTVGKNGKSDFVPINTMNMVTHSSIYQSYKYSFTTAQNLVFDTRGLHQRIASTGVKIGDVDFHLYNDVISPFFLLFGDGRDQGITGGGFLTVHNLFGNREWHLTLGNDVYTGRSISDNSPSDFPYQDRHGKYRLYANQNPFDQLLHPGFNESLNMGRTYLVVNNQWGSFSVSHAGVFDMFSQNIIHDHIKSTPITAPDGSLITSLHHFRSTTANQWIISGGGFYRN